MTRLRIGTRGSALALWQAETVARLLEAGGATTEIVRIKTAGDRLQDHPAEPSPSKGVFVKEIEDALLGHDVDVAVHSAKDMPAVLPAGLTIAAVLPREDARDALVLRRGASGAPQRIATSSVRRIAQLTRLLPSSRFLPIRGNVDSRLRKLDEGIADALVLAVAGLVRLDRADRISERLSLEDCTPAPGQGVVAIEIRGGDTTVSRLVGALNDPDTATAFAAERALVAALGGGCQLPLGAYATVAGQNIAMHAVVTSPDGAREIRRTARGDARRPEAVGEAIAAALVEGGARTILDAIG